MKKINWAIEHESFLNKDLAEHCNNKKIERH